MSKQTSTQLVVPPIDYIQLSIGAVNTDTQCPDNCRGLIIEIAGNINCTMMNGSVIVNLPVTAGYFTGMFRSIQSSTATNIWAIV